MNVRQLCAALVLLLAPAALSAQDMVVDREPVLRVDAGGPTAVVTSLAFSPNDNVLYTAGFDKLVRAYAHNGTEFIASKDSYRVPIGPGIDGAINAIALSPDGAFLAVAGRGVLRGAPSHRERGIFVPTLQYLSQEMWEDQGTISVIETRTGAVRQLRGHPGQVAYLAFAPAITGQPLTLASIGRERQGDKFEGAVRVWDVDRGSELARLAELPDLVANGRFRTPRLDVARTGPRGTRVRVAIAWDDGKGRLWEVEGNKGPVATWNDGEFNSTVALLPGGDEVLTGSWVEGKGRLTIWSVNAKEGAKVVRRLPLSPGQRPRALTLCASRKEAAADRIALVSDDSAKAPEFFLRLYSLDKFEPLTKPVSLWSGTTLPAKLAVSRDGQFLAAAGNKDHQILTFVVADLLGKQVPARKLQGAGVPIRSTAFVRKGKDVGLVLSLKAAQDIGKPQAPRDGDWVFDLATRRLNGDLTGWALDAPNLKGWTTVAQSERNDEGVFLSHYIKVQGPNVDTRVSLKPTQFITRHALLPPGASLNRALLAVAYSEAGQPGLSIFAIGDKGAPEHIGQFNGHSSTITSLAFNEDGRFLLSSADDQTTCVWELVYLPKFLGRQGYVYGVFLKDLPKEGGLAVDSFDKAHPNGALLAKAGIRSGQDVVEGIEVDGKLAKLATLRSYTDAIVLAPPGKPVKLCFKGGKKVEVIAGQCIGQQIPLFSLFLTQAKPGVSPQWIGWSPVGPYDFSDRAAEQMLGWHQNTGDAKKPATFAAANEYRDVYYRPDILRYLIARGNTGAALEDWKKDHPEKVREPKMSLWIRELGPAAAVDDRGRARIEQPQVTLVLSVQELSGGSAESVSWQIGKESGKFLPDGDGEWTARVPEAVWKRGDHRIQATLRTSGADARDYPRELLVRYQPPRPMVKLTRPAPRAVDKPEYRLEAEVVPGSGQSVDVTLQQNGGKDLLGDKVKKLKDKAVVDQVIKLEPGLNRLRLTAKNSGTDDAAESDYLAIDVLYKAPRPQISLTALRADSGPETRLDPSQLDKAVIVDLPEVRILGEIEALDELSTAAWAQGEPEKGEKRGPLKIEKGKRTPFEQKVALTKPGQTVIVRFYARTMGSEEAEGTILLRYEPRLPELRIDGPTDGQPLFLEKAVVEGRLIWTGDRQPCTLQLIVNDKTQGEAVSLAPPADAKLSSSSFKAAALLQPGDNWVQVRTKNEWRETTSTKLLVSYRRPPRIVSVDGPKTAAKPFADVTAVVESPRGLPLTQIKLNGAELSAKEFEATVSKEEGETATYQVVLRGRALVRGGNHFEFLAANRDGCALRPRSVTVDFKEVAAPAAEVTLLDPRQDGVVEDGNYTVEFKVRSRSPLKKVELLLNDEKVYHKADLDKVVKGADDFYEVKEKHAIVLKAGPNALKVVAHNDGGAAVSSPVVLTYKVEPLTILFDEIEAAGKRHRSLGGPREGVLHFPAMDQDQVTVHGHVQWLPQNDKRMATINHVRVYVNGCQHAPAVLEKADQGKRQRRFKVAVRLTRPVGNEIAVRVPELGQEAGSRSRCQVNLAPTVAVAEVRRQAHLLIVDTGKDGEKPVTDRVLQALHAKAGTGPRFSLPGFADGGRLYGPLVGSDVAPERVYVQLLSIKRNLQLRAAAGATDDVVFLYFRSGEAIDAQGHFFRTSDSERDPELRWSGIPCDYLRRFCAENLGAQIVLFDVTRETPPTAATPDRVAQWSEDPSVAVLRYAWLGSAQNQGQDARLIDDWKLALKPATSLKVVLDSVADSFAKKDKYRSLLSHSQHLPANLKDFTLLRP